MIDAKASYKPEDFSTEVLDSIRTIAAEAAEHPEWDRVQREYRWETRPEVVLGLLEKIDAMQREIDNLSYDDRSDLYD